MIMSTLFSKIKYVVLPLLCLLFTVKASAQNATTILDKAATTYENANGIEANFTLHTYSDVQNTGESMEGMIRMKGDKFTLTTPDALIWFDGTTQWVYVKRNEEVNVSNPSGEELQFTNPTLLLRNYKKDYKAAYKGESTATNGKAAYDIELTPKKKGDIEKVNMQIEKYASLPASITITTTKGIQTAIYINKLSVGQNQPDASFRFNEADYPDADIVDLR